MSRIAALLAVVAFCHGTTVALAQGPPAPPEPPRLIEESEATILQTSFAAEHGPLDPTDPTAPAESSPTPIQLGVDLNGEFRSVANCYSRFRYLPSHGARGFGITELEFGNDSSATWWEDYCEEGATRLRADLGFGVHWWSGPQWDATQHTVLPAGPGIYQYQADLSLPPRVYDLYLDLLWQEHWTDRFMTDVLASPGLFTDFHTTPPQSFRLRGHAVALYSVGPEAQLVGGVDFINRLNIKCLPVAGVLYRPSEDTRLQLVFPEPKISHRVGTRGDREYWLFAAGEYGGGVWTYKTTYSWWAYHILYPPPFDPTIGGGGVLEYDGGTGTGHERVEYSDIRLTAGIELVNRGEANPTAVLEFGYVCHRRIILDRAGLEFTPKDTFLVGLRFNH
jgi:hypothetical protein